jgi:hypothetical protein
MMAVLLALLFQGATTPVQMGALVRPDTITVGDHFVFTVRVRAPRGATIAFPEAVDSASSVDAVDSRVLTPSTDTAVTEVTASYRLAAWDTGAVALPFQDVVVTVNGAARRIRLGGHSVYVRSVLPADTTQRVPKPARDIFAAVRPWWHWLLLGLAILAVVGLLIWWWRRRRRRVRVIPIDPYADAKREFAHIEELQLLDAGERGRYVALHVEVLRDYLAARLPQAVLSLTSTELLHAVQRLSLVPLDRLAPLLAEADLIKFARRPVTDERARELGESARTIVERVEERRRAELAAEKERAA